MIGYILIFSYIFIIALWLAKVLKHKISLTFSLAFIFIMIVLYISGLMGSLITGDIVLKIIVCGCLCDLYFTRKSYKLTDLTDSSIFLLIIFYIISIYLFKDNIPLQHNEIAHWALSVKNFYISNSLSKTNDLHVGYMPSVGLLGYWFLRFFKSFSDNMIYIVNSFFTYSLVISICYQIKAKQKFFISVITIFLLPSVSNIVFNYLYIEPILALLFVLGLIFLINNEKNSGNSIILLLVVVGLSLLKKVSILFVVMLFLPVLSDKNETWENKMKFILPSLTACILINCYWKDFLIFNNLCQARDISGINFHNVINFIQGKGEPYQYSVITNIFNALIGKGYSTIKYSGYVIPNIYFFFPSIICMASCAVWAREHKIRQFISAIIAFNIVYILSLTITYMFSFAEWETTTLSGFKRYFQVINIVNLLGIIYIYCFPVILLNLRKYSVTRY